MNEDDKKDRGTAVADDGRVLEIISRKEAQELGLKRYFTGKKCVCGHTDERYISGSDCLSCKSMSASQRKEARERVQIEKQKEYEKLKLNNPGLISYEEAKQKGLSRYFTGKSCKHGHVAERLTSNRGCTTCSNIKRNKLNKTRKIETQKQRDYREEVLDQKHPQRVSRKTAVEQGRTTYFTGNPCKYGHIDFRSVRNRECVECARIRNRQKYDHTYHKHWRRKHKDKINKRNRELRAENPDKYIQMEKDYLERNPLQKFAVSIRQNISSSFRRKYLQKQSSTRGILGCEIQYFRDYIEAQFTEGMSWDNYGMGGWVLDHIKPLAMAKTEEEIIKLCHYTNYQPLWSVNNLSKGAKYNGVDYRYSS